MKKLLAVLVVTLLVMTGCSAPETQSTTKISIVDPNFESYELEITGTSKHIDEVIINSKIQSSGYLNLSEEEIEKHIEQIIEANPVPAGVDAKYSVEGDLLHQELVLHLNQMEELPAEFMSTEYASVKDFQALGTKALVEQFLENPNASIVE